MQFFARFARSIGRAPTLAVAASAAFGVWVGLGASTAARSVRADDSLRVLVRDSDGDSEETTLEGTVKSISPDAIAFDADDGARSVPTSAVLWARFDDEPPELSAVRAALQIDDPADALDKLDALDAAETKNARPWVAQDVDALRAIASGRLALESNDAAALKKAGAELNAFLKKSPESWRVYDASSLVGDILTRLGENDAAKPFFERLTQSADPAIAARGRIALGEFALQSGDVERAKTLFADAESEIESANGTPAAASDSTDPTGSAGSAAGGASEYAVVDATEIAVRAKLGKARAIAKEGNFAESERAFADAIAEIPRGATRLSAVAYNALGAARAEAGRTKEAIVARLHVELLYPSARSERRLALEALVELWTKAGEPERAAAARETLESRFGERK